MKLVKVGLLTYEISKERNFSAVETQNASDLNRAEKKKSENLNTGNTKILRIFGLAPL